ncbi:MAG: hypothetical protein IJX25_03700 [Clostridia bacterium]|nr:hypothetical protein [Clostridia bacterium]MBQ8792273.1 hypothetical protein [Clostridia bacterium]
MKGVLKNKIATTLAAGFLILTINNALFVLSSSYHLFKQDYDKRHLKEEEFASSEQYQEAIDYCDSEIERVTPIRKGLIIATGASAGASAVTYACGAIHEKRKKRKIEKETDIYIGG